MKILKILSVLVIFVLFSCSNDSDSGIKNGDGQGGSLAIFALKGNYLYTVDDSSLNVFSLLNENQPVKVNEVQIGFNIETLFSYGDYLFVGSRDGMFIYSIENPENPVMASSAQHFTACDPVVANATHTFVTLHSNTTCGNNTNMLEIYDTTNPNNPILIHQRNLVAPKGLGLYNNYLIVCDDVIKVFDIQNPAEPLLVNTIDKNCSDIIVRENELYAISDIGMYRYQLDPATIENIVFKSEISF